MDVALCKTMMHSMMGHVWMPASSAASCASAKYAYLCSKEVFVDDHAHITVTLLKTQHKLQQLLLWRWQACQSEQVSAMQCCGDGKPCTHILAAYVAVCAVTVKKVQMLLPADSACLLLPLQSICNESAELCVRASWGALWRSLNTLIL